MHKRLFPYLTPPLSPASPNEQVIELRDGAKVILKRDSTFVCIDAEGRRITLEEGIVLEAKDGTQYMVKSNSLWKQVGRRRPDPEG